MPTILHLIDQPHPGGAQTIFVDVAAGLHSTPSAHPLIRSSAYTCLAAVPGPGWVADELGRRGLTPILTPVKRGPFDHGYLRQIWRIIRSEKVDLVHAHLLGPSVYGSIAGIFAGPPVISTFHGYVDVAPDERFRTAKFALINAAAGAIVFVSDHLRQHFLRVTNVDPVHSTVVHNGVDFGALRRDETRAFRREIGVGEEEFLVGAIGHLRPPKAYDVLLRAAALLRGQGAARFRFVIVGQPEGNLLEELFVLRDQLGLGDAVIFAGYRPDIDRVISGLDLYVISSSTEGFSLSAVQAMALGIPVVATRCGGPEEIVTDGETGLLVEVGNPGAIAAAVTRMLNDPQLRQQFTATAGHTVRGRFSREQMLAGYHRLYEGCLRAARR